MPHRARSPIDRRFFKIVLVANDCKQNSAIDNHPSIDHSTIMQDSQDEETALRDSEDEEKLQ
jgi:hypothetical protein